MNRDVRDMYKVLLPDWVFLTDSEGRDEIEKNAKLYLSKSYPDRHLIKVDGSFAHCTLK